MYGAAMSPSEPPKPQPYPEHDKLGPIGIQTSAIHDPAALRGALIRAFEAAAQDAKDAVARSDKDLAGAVHASRKALRRARAVLGLVARALPKSEHRAVRRALQEARRALSSVRDHAVAPDTLGQLALDDADRETATRVVGNAAGALPPSAETVQLLAESAARAAAQAEALQAALPHDIDWDVVARGLRDTYAEARDAAESSKKSRSWFHTWRRRSKELVYQLELVSNHAGPRLVAIHSEVAGVTDMLSSAVDLIMLREFIATHDAGVATGAIDHLRDTIDANLEDLMKAARKAARDAFHMKPRKFEKRITKSVRRDLAPPDEPNGAPGDAHDDL